MSDKRQKTIDSIGRRLLEGVNPRPYIRLKADSFISMRKPAIFIDEEYGEWEASPNGVLSGGMHPKRRSRSLPEITLSKDDFMDLYLKKNHSVDEIAEMFSTSKAKVIQKIREFQCQKPMDLKLEIMKRTSRERYGVENAMQLEEVQKKAISNTDTKARNEKAKQTCFEKYGVDNVFQTPEVREKRRKSMLEAYGVEHALQNAGLLDKCKRTTVERFGVENVLQTPFVRERVKEILGVEHPFQSPVIQQKVKETFKQKYGSESPGSDPEIQKKIKDTIFKRYGRHHLSTEEVRAKIKETSVERWGFPCPLQNPDIKEISYQTRLAKDNFNVSAAERSIRKLVKKWLPEEAVLNNIRSVIAPLELDIYIPSRNLAIEYNGLYSHSEEFKDRWYHFDKTQRCVENGIQLVTVFEHEWHKRRSAVITRLRSLLGVNTIRLGARQTTSVEIEHNDAAVHKFLNRYHVQGSASFEKGFALFHENIMVAVMTFNRHHRQTSKEMVLNRFCVRYNHSISGGASKLLKAACLSIKESIVSYSDNRWSVGNLYRSLGFEIANVLPPDYFYTKNKKYFSKQSLRKTVAERLSGKTERELRLEQGFRRVYDCGKVKWRLK